MGTVFDRLLHGGVIGGAWSMVAAPKNTEKKETSTERVRSQSGGNRGTQWHSVQTTVNIRLLAKMKEQWSGTVWVRFQAINWKDGRRSC